MSVFFGRYRPARCDSEIRYGIGLRAAPAPQRWLFCRAQWAVAMPSSFWRRNSLPAIRVLPLDLPPVSTADEALYGLRSVLNQAGLSSAYFLGASYSGLLVQALAKTNPQCVRGLILSHTGSLDAARAPRELRSAALARRIPGFVVRGAIRLLVSLVLRRHGAAAEFWRDVYQQALDEVSPAYMASRYLLASQLDRTGGAPYAGPVLVIHSDHDAITPDAQRQKLLRDYPQAQFNKFVGTGHSSYSLQPLEYAAAIRRFVEIGA